jgi:transcriptional regulator with XRE-family HTH domain
VIGFERTVDCFERLAMAGSSNQVPERIKTMNYGKAIRTVRAAKNLEQKELAQLAKLNASYISLLESNRRSPSAAALDSLARALRVPIYLLSLLASEKQDLHGISEDEASKLGAHLLQAIVEDQQAD